MGFSRLSVAGLLGISPTLIIIYSVTGKKIPIDHHIKKAFLGGDCNNLLG